MLTVSDLPTVNATLNAIAAVLLAAGYLLIRSRQVGLHRAVMLSAFGVSALFLVSYVVYHASAGSKRFEGTGWTRPVYFSILVTHVLLAATMVPPVIMTLARALSGRYAAHARLARRTLPVWIYVSITGVVVYAMLYL